MKKLLFYLSITLNLLLIACLCYSLYFESYTRNYFEFTKQAFFQDSCSNGLVCFVGNSITANWIIVEPEFFEENGFVNRGIGGQSSTQILLRFQQDVVSLSPKTLILNTGINDIGEEDGFYKQSFTIQNIQSMIDICKIHNIELILTSVLPATEIKKNRFVKIKDVQNKIGQLNMQIEKLANTNNLKYIDYNSKLRNTDGTFNEIYTFDGIHPNEKGYEIMQSLIIDTINN